MSYHPSQTTPALSEERLQLLATTIVAVRADARDGHLPEKGDNPWTFGCRAYSRTCFALERHALSGDYPWLRVDVAGLACTLFLEEEAIKFYRGEAEKPGTRTLSKGFAEAKQGALSFFKDELAAESGWFWLLAIETKEDGSVLRLALFQANKRGNTHNLYFIPIGEESVAVVSGLAPIQPEGPDLAPPTIAPKAPSLPAANEASEDDEVSERDEASGTDEK